MILRKKNFELREEGKDPHKGWHPMVDTGLVDANGALVKINRVTIDITSNNHETFNFFLEEQRRVADQIKKQN